MNIVSVPLIRMKRSIVLCGLLALAVPESSAAQSRDSVIIKLSVSKRATGHVKAIYIGNSESSYAIEPQLVKNKTHVQEIKIARIKEIRISVTFNEYGKHGNRDEKYMMHVDLSEFRGDVISLNINREPFEGCPPSHFKSYLGETASEKVAKAAAFPRRFLSEKFDAFMMVSALRVQCRSYKDRLLVVETFLRRIGVEEGMLSVKL